MATERTRNSATSAPASRRRCPVCSKPAEPRHLPFCSARCADIDLGRWLKGNYRIAGDETPGDDDDADRGEPAG